MTSGYYTTTQSETFTVTHARHIVAKVAADLKRMQRFYGQPHDNDIDTYEKESTALLRGDYLDTITYGFHRGGVWVFALKYVARQGGVLIADDTPGRVPLGVDTRGCQFASFLEGNGRWDALGEDAKRHVYADAGLRYFRVPGAGYGEGGRDWNADKVYSAAGRGVLRHTIG